MADWTIVSRYGAAAISAGKVMECKVLTGHACRLTVWKEDDPDRELTSMKKHSTLKRVMAKRCDICPPCRYARAKPDTKVGKVISFHGKYCPFWKAWQELFETGGRRQPPPADEEVSDSDPTANRSSPQGEHS